MQPPSVLFGHCFRSDVSTAYSSLGPRSGLKPPNFNFKELSMKKSHSDYLNVKPVRGSSPTASLAADLSQNFHIDQSPQLATPRRSLFSSNLFGHGHAEETMTTPPLPSSSPAPAMDIMEMSPLPHKPPFSIAKTIEIITSCTEESRRRPTFLRPSLAKSKAQSFQFGMAKPAPESQAPPFRFQTKGGKTSLSTSASLEDMFGESPQRERPLFRNHSSSGLANPRLRAPLGTGNGSHVRGNGSPSAASIRKHSNPLMRPRKQCRRSLSMYEHPEDVIVEKEACFTSNAPLQSICDIEATPSLHLPHFIPEDQGDSLPRIDKTILLELMDGKFNDQFDNVLIIDCRFEYEYEGGHITGAVNYNDKESLATRLFTSPTPRTALVLHCEYSAHRAPIMAKYIRHRDRAYNVDHYPQLTYPDLYILEGGYSAFFADHRSLCYPQNYVEMSAKEYEYACERGLGKVKQRSKLNRAQTFAFGQNSPDMEDSPTGRCRSSVGDRTRLLGSPFAESPGSGRYSGRRMLSY
ncbi:hypothetical protein EYZ11_001392 [Aspergillus tanneri]|uniref:M-phase inducer phosphatase n=1 Tax=Aspergillus tanneri TaxID=1220188 RepID=A0A4S3JUT3_9EURO|nr:hypothetical protein EYZ11_001392 [Aspergillus tanneri]